MTVTWLAAATADVIGILEHIAEENPLAGQRVARALLLAGDRLALSPRRGRLGRTPGTRELLAIRP